jgi:hypothetical protein
MLCLSPDRGAMAALVVIAFIVTRHLHSVLYTHTARKQRDSQKETDDQYGYAH